MSFRQYDTVSFGTLDVERFTDGFVQIVEFLLVVLMSILDSYTSDIASLDKSTVACVDKLYDVPGTTTYVQSPYPSVYY